MLYIPFPFKRCSKCNQCFPTTRKYFYSRKDGKDGLRSECKQCSDARKTQWMREHPDRVQEQHRKWRANNLDKARESVRRSQHLHPDKRKERDKEWRKAHPENARNATRRWRLKNPDKTRESHQRYAKNNPQKIVVYSSRYRALKRKLPNTFLPTDWNRCLDYWQNTCAVCGRPQGLWHTLAADHWIPLISTDCPGTVPTNILPLCHGVGGCNNSKGSSDPNQWLAKHFGPRKAKVILKRIEQYFAWVKDQT